MTRDEAKATALVLLAYAEGKKIQVWDHAYGWIDCPNPDFMVHFKCPYRVKPESIWLNMYPYSFATAHRTKELADSGADADRIACIEVAYTEGQGLDK